MARVRLTTEALFPYKVRNKKNVSAAGVGLVSAAAFVVDLRLTATGARAHELARLPSPMKLSNPGGEFDLSNVSDGVDAR